jgi:hypothetical protein
MRSPLAAIASVWLTALIPALLILGIAWHFHWLAGLDLLTALLFLALASGVYFAVAVALKRSEQRNRAALDDAICAISKYQRLVHTLEDELAARQLKHRMDWAELASKSRATQDRAAPLTNVVNLPLGELCETDPLGFVHPTPTPSKSAKVATPTKRASKAKSPAKSMTKQVTKSKIPA